MNSYCVIWAKKLIEPTESSSQWKGALGKSLETCETLSLSSKGIQRISGRPSLPELDVKDLRRDQAYLYKIIKAIIFNLELLIKHYFVKNKDLCHTQDGSQPPAQYADFL